jgi:hypothetical protein
MCSNSSTVMVSEITPTSASPTRRLGKPLQWRDRHARQSQQLNVTEDHLAGLRNREGSGAKIRNNGITFSHKEAKIMYSGIDLHSDNSVVAIIDDADHVVAQKRLPNDVAKIVSLMGYTPALDCTP